MVGSDNRILIYTLQNPKSPSTMPAESDLEDDLEAVKTPTASTVPGCISRAPPPPTALICTAPRATSVHCGASCPTRQIPKSGTFLSTGAQLINQSIVVGVAWCRLSSLCLHSPRPVGPALPLRDRHSPRWTPRMVWIRTRNQRSAELAAVIMLDDSAAGSAAGSGLERG